MAEIFKHEDSLFFRVYHLSNKNSLFFDSLKS